MESRHPFVVGLAVSAVITGNLWAQAWKPIDPAHLAMKAPVVEKDADAEALFREVRVEWDDSALNNTRTVLSHYIRIKVFTERGRETQSKIVIPFSANDDVRDIAARTIKPDGSIAELKKDAVFEQTVRRGNRAEEKAKSFALPGVEIGSIIEYRYREFAYERLSMYVPLRFQMDIPVQMVKYSIRPVQRLKYITKAGSRDRVPLAMRSHSFQCENTPLALDRDGTYSTTLANVPAFREEPFMPPAFTVQPWVLVYYSEDRTLAADKFWRELGRENYHVFQQAAKVNDTVRKAAEEAIGDASAPEEKLRRLFAFCRSSIKNTRARDAESEDERTEFKHNEFPADTLKQKAGSGLDINRLFAAMAIAAGFDARETRACDRDLFIFDPSFRNQYFLTAFNVAVDVGGHWRLFDPAADDTPFGMLRWQEEGTSALISGPDGGVQFTAPLSTAEQSARRRVANFQLLADGSLQGQVRIELNGHAAAESRMDLRRDSPARREEKVLESVRSRFGNAEVTDVRVENVTDPEKPLVETYNVHIAGYAQLTGKRLLVQPSFFQRGVASMFPTSQRKYPIYFHYPWLEEDTVTIQPPAGFSVETSATPAPLAGKLGMYEVKIGQEDGKLVYSRKLRFGDNASILFSVGEYPQLKKIFDWVYKSDGYTVSLKQTVAP